jgi:hypothetical protein
VYGDEAGPEEGYGFADFGRTIRVAAVVFARAVFQDYLARELKKALHELRPVQVSRPSGARGRVCAELGSSPSQRCARSERSTLAVDEHASIEP